MKALIKRIILIVVAMMMFLPTALADEGDVSYATVIREDRDRGACRMMRGSISLTVVLVAADGKTWSTSDVASATNTVNKAIATLEREASSYGVALDITPSFYHTRASSDTDSASWRKTVINSIPELKAVSSWANRPVLFILNTDGRSYASTGGNVMEFVVFYLEENAGTVRHELLHLYGAEDFYFHDDMLAAAERHFPNSVMIRSNENSVTDPLSAYLVGWTSTPDRTASAFLNDIAHLTRSDVDTARAKDQQSGMGAFQLRSGMYYGNLDFGCANGPGLHQWSDGSAYVGDWSWNTANGKGTYTWADGNTYTGDFVDDKRTGKGTYTWNDGSTYTGDFVGGERTGMGTYTWPSGSTYTGDFVSGNRTGKGTYTWADGSTYTGDFVDNCLSGKGVMCFKNGNTYIGEFKNNQLEGMGTMYYADGTCKTGQWSNGALVSQ